MLALLLSATALSLTPSQHPASLLTPRIAVAVPSRAAVACCDAKTEQYIEGDGIYCRDEESQAWWRATVREVRDDEVLVHFTGCDDAWDQWFPADSPDIYPFDTDGQGREQSAFQSDTIEETMDDEEMLEEYRRRRWIDNAKWQLTTFAQSQLGSWKGEIELYELDGSGGVRKRVGPWTPDCSCEMAAVTNEEVGITDSLPSVATEYAVDLRYDWEAFRPEMGNMAVASAFTLATPSPSSTGEPGWLLEVAIGEEERRVRCKLLYRTAGTAAPPADAPADAMDGEAVSGSAEGGGVPAMSLVGAAIVREARDGGGFLEAVDNDAAGRGLYDPPKGNKMEYCSLYVEGGVTFVFPTVVAGDGAGVVSLDWIAGNMRYQIDRKFKALDGSLSSLELTEIQKSDAERIAPDFPHQGGAIDA